MELHLSCTNPLICIAWSQTKMTLTPISPFTLYLKCSLQCRVLVAGPPSQWTRPATSTTSHFESHLHSLVGSAIWADTAHFLIAAHRISPGFLLRQIAAVLCHKGNLFISYKFGNVSTFVGFKSWFNPTTNHINLIQLSINFNVIWLFSHCFGLISRNSIVRLNESPDSSNFWNDSRGSFY